MSTAFRFPLTMLRLPAVIQATALPRSTVYWHIKQGLLPSPIKISERSVAWAGDEIAAIVAARRAGANNQQIKLLVAQLEGKRLANVEP